MMMVTPSTAELMGPSAIPPPMSFGAAEPAQRHSTVGASQVGPPSKGGRMGGSDFMDPMMKRKLISDVKTEVRPLITQMCESQVKRAVDNIEKKMRNIEKTLTGHFNNLRTSFEREVKAARKEAKDRDD
jgi:hypothetical protein